MANNGLDAYSMNKSRLLMHSDGVLLAGVIAAQLGLLENVLLCPRHHDLVLLFTPQNATFTADILSYPFRKIGYIHHLPTDTVGCFWGSSVVLFRSVDALLLPEIFVPA
jgi:hypothetical protein